MENKLKNTRTLALVATVVLFVMQLLGIRRFVDVLPALGYGLMAFSIFKNKKDVVTLVGAGALVLRGLIRIFTYFSLLGVLEILATLMLFGMILIEAIPTIDKEEVMGRIPGALRGYIVYFPALFVAVSGLISLVNTVFIMIQYGTFGYNFVAIWLSVIGLLISVAAYLFISMWAMNIVVLNTEAPNVIAEENKPEGTKPAEASSQMPDNEMYIDLALHVILLLATCGIWQYIWIYRTTKVLNNCQGEEYRNPTYKLLLCMFIPFYYIYWTYKSAQRVDKMYTMRGASSDIATLCLILSIFIGIVPPILIQMKINGLAEKPASAAQPQPQQATQTVQETPKAPETNVDVAEEIRKFKELLDSGAITQEEYDLKKKQLLDI